MLSEALHVIKGNLLWHYIKVIHKMDKHSIVLILAGENKAVDKNAVRYLPVFAGRRYANKVFIWTEDEQLLKEAKKNCQIPVEKLKISARRMRLLFEYYCFDRFYFNLIFTYINQPKDNMIGKLFSKSDINEEEIVCLGLYNLRRVPAEYDR